MTEIIAIPDNLRGKTGAIAYWRLSGRTNRERFEQELKTSGLDSFVLPALCRPNTALLRALKARADLWPRCMFKSHPDGGYAVLRETNNAGEIGYEQLVRFYVNDTEDPDDDYAVNWKPAIFDDGGDLEKPRRVYEAYKEARESYSTTDIGKWLAWYATHVCSAISLRDSGGFYFVPPSELELWREVTGCLEIASNHTIFELPAMASEDAVEAILDGVRRETLHRIELTKKLMIADPGTKAYQSELRRVEDQICKIEMYEELVGRKVTELSTECDMLRVQLAQVILDREASS